MEEIRGMFRAQIVEEVEAAVQDHTESKGRDIREELFDHLALQLAVASWPPSFHASGGCSLSTIVQGLQDLEVWTAGCCDDCLNEMELRRVVATFEKYVCGLCLRCVREDTLTLSWKFEEGQPVYDSYECGHED